MTTTAVRTKSVPVDPDPTAVGVDVSDTMLRITLSDARELAAPLAWVPRLRDATVAQRLNWEKVGRGHGIHWADIDEDISVRALLGRPT